MVTATESPPLSLSRSVGAKKTHREDYHSVQCVIILCNVCLFFSITSAQNPLDVITGLRDDHGCDWIIYIYIAEETSGCVCRYVCSDKTCRQPFKLKWKQRPGNLSGRPFLGDHRSHDFGCPVRSHQVLFSPTRSEPPGRSTAPIRQNTMGGAPTTHRPNTREIVFLPHQNRTISSLDSVHLVKKIQNQVRQVH